MSSPEKQERLLRQKHQEAAPARRASPLYDEQGASYRSSTPEWLSRLAPFLDADADVVARSRSTSPSVFHYFHPSPSVEVRDQPIELQSSQGASPSKDQRNKKGSSMKDITGQSDSGSSSKASRGKQVVTGSFGQTLARQESVASADYCDATLGHHPYPSHCLNIDGSRVGAVTGTRKQKVHQTYNVDAGLRYPGTKSSSLPSSSSSRASRHRDRSPPQSLTRNLENFHPHMQPYATQATAHFSSMPPDVDPDHASAAAYQYVPPKEYTFPVETKFSYRTEHDLIFRKLSDEQRNVIVDRIHEVRPYVVDSIRKKLNQKLDVPMARDLLSSDTDRIYRAIEKIYPILRMKRTADTTWMTGLSNEQRLLVIKKLAEATHQRSDELLDHFLRQDVAPEVALEILVASMEECVEIAKRETLLVHDGVRAKPWQKGLSKAQRKAVIHRIMTYTGKETSDHCYEMLRRDFIPSRYGLVMLRASDKEFEEIVEWIINNGSNP
ncbi:hypothetical protein CBS101457_000207 [Exobasidium rhododendri]|nr:hypothetical protein CBS101457_000207 [Exobasidium rhododendri]